MLFIGGGFSALLTSARLRERGVESIRIVERGGDVGGTWYWNRYPGVACDVVAYDYLPLLDEMDYVPTRHYAQGPEIFAHCQAIARKYDLYDLAVFQTTVTSTVWDEAEQKLARRDRPWRPHDRPLRHLRQRHAGQAAPGDHRRAWSASRATASTRRGGTTTTPGATWTSSATRWSASSGPAPARCRSIPNLGANAKELYVFQRTPSSIDIRDDWQTEDEWAAKLKPGLAGQARGRRSSTRLRAAAERNSVLRDGITREEKIRRQENAEHRRA